VVKIVENTALSANNKVTSNIGCSGYTSLFSDLGYNYSVTRIALYQVMSFRASLSMGKMLFLSVAQTLIA